MLLAGFPFVTDVYPTYGPLAGGTEIMVIVEIPEEVFTSAGIYFGDAFFPVNET
jgi:hypothetical protein